MEALIGIFLKSCVSRQIGNKKMALPAVLIVAIAVSHEKAAAAAEQAAEAPRDPSEKSVTVTSMQESDGATMHLAEGAIHNNSENCKANASALRGCSPTPHHDTAGCFEACRYAGDGECDDGGPGREFALCAYGSDCGDCGARATLCANSCSYHFDGDCDDGGLFSAYTLCHFGSDCGDCGPRAGGAEHGPAAGGAGYRRTGAWRAWFAAGAIALTLVCLWPNCVYVCARHRYDARAWGLLRGGGGGRRRGGGGEGGDGVATGVALDETGPGRWRAPSGLVVVEGIVVRPAGAAGADADEEAAAAGESAAVSAAAAGGSGAGGSEGGEEAPAAAAAPSGPVVVEGRRVLL